MWLLSINTYCFSNRDDQFFLVEYYCKFHRHDCDQVFSISVGPPTQLKGSAFLPGETATAFSSSLSSSSLVLLETSSFVCLSWRCIVLVYPDVLLKTDLKFQRRFNWQRIL